MSNHATLRPGVADTVADTGTDTVGTDTAGAADWLVSPELAPDTGGHLAPLYAGAARGELVLPFCPVCDLPLELDQEVCDGCGALGATWRPVPREGTVHTVTVVHRREPGLVVAADPYPVADVELASGHRLLVAGRRPSPAPAIGTPVTLSFRAVGGTAVPAFDPPFAPPAAPPADPPPPELQELPR